MEAKKAIFISLFITYAFFTNTYLTTSDASRFSLTASIAEDHTLVIGDYPENVIADWWWPKDFAFYNGKIYSDKAPLGSFLGLVPYLIVRIFTTDLGALIFSVSLLTTGLLTALTAVLLYEIGKDYTNNENHRIIVALLYGLGTPAFFYATVFFSHAITAFFAFAAYHLIHKSRDNHAAVVNRNLIIAGIFAGLAVSSDYYAGIISFALFLYALSIFRHRAYQFLIPLLAVLSLTLVYNWLAFNDPFTFPYFYSNLYREYHSSGFYGIRFPDALFYLNLLMQLFSKWGFFYTTPLAVLALFCFPRFYKKNRAEGISIVIIAAGLLIVTGSIGRFDAYSVRFLTPLIPFLCLSLYHIRYEHPFERKMLQITLLLSIIINTVGADSFLPKISDPNIMRELYGNNNLLGGFLLGKGINVHYLTIAPLVFFLIYIWRKEIKSYIRQHIQWKSV